MTSLPLDSRENYDLCMAGPGSGGVDRKSWVVQRRRAPQSGCSTPVFPLEHRYKKGSTPSSSKYCLVCGIILRNENFYALSRPELLCALNAILQTTVQFPLVKEDQRRVCKSCFRRLELIKDKKSVLEALEKEFQGKYNSTVLKNRETTANGQTKIELDVCH